MFRYTTVEDIMNIVPGFDDKGHLNLAKDEETHDENLHLNVQSPTIVL